MPKRRSVLPVFSFFLILSFLFYVIFQTRTGQEILGYIDTFSKPLRGGIFTVFAATGGETSEVERLQEEIHALKNQVASLKEQDKEIRALRDQFAVTSPSSQELLPTQIVGFKSYLPGFNLPEQLIINRGERDGVKKDAVVIYKNNLLGKVAIVRQNLAVVDLTFKNEFSITATSLETGALGVIKGKGDGQLTLENVVLSDTLKKGDLVVTKGSTNSEGVGASPGLVIGEIISIDKKPSALFQTAKMKTPLDVTKLSTVFVLITK